MVLAAPNPQNGPMPHPACGGGANPSSIGRIPMTTQHPEFNLKATANGFNVVLRSRHQL